MMNDEFHVSRITEHGTRNAFQSPYVDSYRSPYVGAYRSPYVGAYRSHIDSYNYDRNTKF